MNIINMIKFQSKLIIKTPIIMVYYLVYPIVLTAIIGYLTSSSYGNGVTSYEYYSIGMMIFIFSGSGIAAAYNFIDNAVKPGNGRLIYAPVKGFYLYFSQIVTVTIFSALAIAFSMTIFTLFFGVNYGENFVLIFLAFLALSFMSSALGILLATIFNDVGPVNGVFNIIQAVLCLLGGAFMSIEALGKVPAMLSKLSPIKWLMDGLMYSIFDNDNSLLLITIVINLVLGIIFIFICAKTFKRENYI
ncbi:MAG: ABC transporter permease [Clostridium sp.]